ncbi:TetR/AcrR family transcriptional regulator [Nocardioides ferulae]|uniref:TetR/AcrR family transcriptional regulator n=1 Tax=Nocardioides ferulae TaxID=2340821 RepID=UPI000EB53A1E|nr:TetR/AcrR family transcriptional regulator [Nocardioides ferulae]
MTETLPPDLVDLLEAVAGRPGVGLRERKKIATMRRLQRIAVEQFEEHGFDRVTVEHIAEHAEVSPSTVYRYFGTKEGLVLRDEYDDIVMEVFTRLMGEHDPWTAFTVAMRIVGESHFTVDGDSSLRRTRIWYETPAVRAAGFMLLDETAKQLAPIMHAHDRFGRSLEDYRVVSASLVAALFACLEQWYERGGDSDLVETVVHAVELIRPAWATPPPN